MRISDWSSDVCSSDLEGATEAARALFKRRSRPDAIFCANDHMALAAIEVARSEFGLEVGRDVSIIGFDDIAMAAWPSHSLTPYSQPTKLMDQRPQFTVPSMLCTHN